MPIIAVDGPSASGKGTISRALAHHFSLPHLDTGALYRALALATIRNKVAPDDVEAIVRLAPSIGTLLTEDEALRTERVADIASRIAPLPAIRLALRQYQEDFARQPGGAILDGRDIGTVIVPDADAKLFITASPDVRARRRYEELCKRGLDTTLNEVRAEIDARDRRDSDRRDSPLRQAEDAILLDTSNFDIQTSIRRAVDHVSARLGRSH